MTPAWNSQRTRSRESGTETYPRGPDSADPFNTQAQCPGELHTPGGTS